MKCCRVAIFREAAGVVAALRRRDADLADRSEKLLRRGRKRGAGIDLAPLSVQPHSRRPGVTFGRAGQQHLVRVCELLQVFGHRFIRSWRRIRQEQLWLMETKNLLLLKVTIAKGVQVPFFFFFWSDWVIPALAEFYFQYRRRCREMTNRMSPEIEATAPKNLESSSAVDEVNHLWRTKSVHCNRLRFPSWLCTGRSQSRWSGVGRPVRWQQKVYISTYIPTHMEWALF